MGKIASKDVGDNMVTFKFLNGTVLEACITEMDADIRNHLALHGLSQKIGDSYAGAETIEEAIGCAQAVLNNLMAGTWLAKAQRGGKVVEALVAFTGKDYAECLDVYGNMDDKQKAALRKHPSIKLELANIDAARAKRLAEVASDDSGEDLTALFN